MKTPRAWLAAALLILAAVFASGGAPQETAPAPIPSQAPASPFRLRVTEPPDGAIIPGRSVRIAIARNVPVGLSGAPPASPVDPSEPDVLVSLDAALKATIPAGQSSLTFENVSPGRHKLTLKALGPGGQALDRKDMFFTTAIVAAPAAASASSEPPAAPPGPPEPAPSTAGRELPAAALPYPLVGLSVLVLLTLGAALFGARHRAHR